MFLSVRPLHDIAMWARGSGLEIVLLVTGAMLLTRFVTWLGARITDRIDAHAQETDALVRSEAAKHRHALAQVITWATLVVIYSATAVAVAARILRARIAAGLRREGIHLPTALDTIAPSGTE